MLSSLLPRSTRTKGEGYFKERLGDIYDYSPIPYMAGTGRVSNGGTCVDVEWELNLAVTGGSVLVVSAAQMIASFNMPGATSLRKWQLAGATSDKNYILSADGLVFSETQFRSGGNFVHFARFADIAIGRCEAAQPDCIVALPLNLNFEGLDWARDGVDLGAELSLDWLVANSQGGTVVSRDRFTANLAGRSVLFRHGKRKDELLQLIDTGRLDRAILCEIQYPLSRGEPIDLANSNLESLAWLTSFFTMNRNCVPAIQLIANGQLAGWRIRSLASAPYNPGRDVIAKRPPGLLKAAIEQTFANFILLDSKIHLIQVVDILPAAGEPAMLELNLAGLILAYEVLLARFLAANGNVRAAKGSIQGKLGAANGIWRFIPSDLLKEELREQIRNELFHQGHVADADTLTSYEWHQKYLDLLFQIVLSVLKYSGEYV